MSNVPTPAVILAAGASTRLGSLKQLATLGDEMLVRRAVRVAREAGCAPLIVVLGAEATRVLLDGLPDDAVPVINEQWQEGMASSIRAGVRACGIAAKEAEGLVVMTCDQPAVTSQHLQQLMSGGGIRASRYAGRNGVPAFFPKEYFHALAALEGDAGARALLEDARYEELEGGELDVDTVEDLERARELLAGGACSSRGMK